MPTECKIPVLDNGNKIPTAKLGDAGASSVTFLRGDQTWAVPLAAHPQPSVHVYREAPTFNHLPLVYMMVDWNGMGWDANNEFSLDTDRYTAATTGKRLITCNFYWSTTVANKLFKICIYKNGVLIKVKDTQAAVADSLSTSISAIIDMIVGDYLQFYTYQNSSGNLNLSMTRSGTYLCIQGLL